MCNIYKETIINISLIFYHETSNNSTSSIQITYFDEVWCISEGQLEGAVAWGEAQRAGLVITLQVVVHGDGQAVHEAPGQQQDSTCNKLYHVGNYI